MRRLPRRALLCALLFAAPPGAAPDLVRVIPNDNRRAAGSLKQGVLTLRLEVRTGVWFPEGPKGDSVVAPVFAEAGKPPQVPGPLIRVPTGTMIDATVTNTLPDSTITLLGFMTRPAKQHDSTRIAPGETKRIRFEAGAPGTYLYAADAGARDTMVERQQLAGGFVVDSAGPRPDDRVFVINIWGDPKPGDSTVYRNALAINGLSWPHSERIRATVGDSLRWRWINASGRFHPMHLHGFYFRLDRMGDALTDSSTYRDKGQLAVTQLMFPRTTMDLTWGPDRPGNWLFHCHIGFHVVPEARLNPPPKGHPDHSAHDPAVHMAGLILGISVQPSRGWREPGRENTRNLRLFVQEGAKRLQAPRALGFVLQQDQRPPAADSVEIPGTTLVLTQNQPTDITVINRLKETAAIHWHGIELESYSDGVPGWGGMGQRLAPSIQPGDSFVARLSLPRPGTFIYHTHMNDIEQITSGLYGAIVVLPPGERFDSARDHLFVAGWDGDGRTLINGNNTPPPLQLAAGVSHRFRFVGIGAASGGRFTIRRDSALVQWRPLARDGADLPDSQRAMRPARKYVGVGETFDVEWIPEPGAYTLTADLFGPPFMTRKLVVR
ncbi:MAG TPA: multicopper oxidase domain-containing protein [Gemmatimonadales bacterium]|nr:multicopper oxidase domain-containing protein [Gemmatimonadales bacterium]